MYRLLQVCYRTLPCVYQAVRCTAPRPRWIVQKECEGLNATENGTNSLEGLARRLEALERENNELRGKVAALERSPARRDEAAGPRGSEPSEELEEGRISRRRLLGKAGAAAAGLVVAGALTQRDIREAQAAGAAFDSPDSAIPGVTGTNSSNGLGSIGVLGRSDYISVKGESRQGSTNFIGVYGLCNAATGGAGVSGDHAGSGPGVTGGSASGPGVQGTSSGAGKGGVEGGHQGGGYGGLFRGGKAQLRLVPSSRTGRPGGPHSKGELYMDSNAALFVCVRSGTPGKWRKISTSAV